MQEPAGKAPRREAGADALAPVERLPRPHTGDSRSHTRSRPGRLRPWRALGVSMVSLALMAAYCDGTDVTRLDLHLQSEKLSAWSSEIALPLGRPALAKAAIQFFGLEDGGLIWSTSDDSVAEVTWADGRGLFEDWNRDRGTHYAIVRTVGLGTAEIIATSRVDPRFEARAVVTVSDAEDSGVHNVRLVPDLVTTVQGDTKTLRLAFAVDWSVVPYEESIVWDVADPSLLTIEDASVLHQVEPWRGYYGATATVRGEEMGVTTLRAWVATRPDLHASAVVTIAPEPNTPFVAIRAGEHFIDTGDTFCVHAYVGMPVPVPDVSLASIEWSLPAAEVLELSSVRWSSPDVYPYTIEACFDPIGPGATELIATSVTWPNASASVTIEVIE